jgi:hypothetical protein
VVPRGAGRGDRPGGDRRDVHAGVQQGAVDVERDQVLVTTGLGGVPRVAQSSHGSRLLVVDISLSSRAVVAHVRHQQVPERRWPELTQFVSLVF